MPKPSSLDWWSYLRSKICGGPNILMLSFWCAPWVVQLEALITVASPAVHAALCCLLLLWRLADVAHDRDCSTSSLAVALNNALQGEVPEQHANAPFTEVNVMLAARTWDSSDPRSHWPSAPPWGRDGTWWRGGREQVRKDQAYKFRVGICPILAEAQFRSESNLVL